MASHTRATCSPRRASCCSSTSRTCRRGPVEFDLAHAPEEVSEHYPGINQDLLRECRILVLAMITTWRWDRSDQLPEMGASWAQSGSARSEKRSIAKGWMLIVDRGSQYRQLSSRLAPTAALLGMIAPPGQPMSTPAIIATATIAASS